MPKHLLPIGTRLANITQLITIYHGREEGEIDMRFRRLCRLGMLICGISLMIPLGGCGSTGVYVGDSPVMQAPPPGPPPHAPAYGYRAKHTYYYYPDAQVYFDTGRDMYFYLDGGSWRMSVSLPNDLRVQLGDHVTIDMDSDKPYLYFDQHQKEYPPGQTKKKKHGKKH